MQFDCAWLQSGAHEDLRPDRINCIFERIGDDIILGTLAPGEISKLVLAQVGSFINEGFSIVLLGNSQQPLIKANSNTTSEEVWNKFQEIVRERHGNS